MADVYTNNGRAHIAGLLSNTVSAPANYFGNVGTAAGTAVVTRTDLFTEVGSARISTTLTRVTTSVTNDTAQNVFTYTATGSVSITNAGIFTASTGSTLVQMSDHATVPLVSGDSIQYTFKAQIV